MYRLPLLFAALVLAAPLTSAQNLELIGTHQFPTTSFGDDDAQRVGGSDVWAYTAPDGSEYAIMGVLDGFAVVAVPSMEIVGHVDGPTEDDVWFHRDVVVRGHYAYTVTENLGTNEGLQIIDLSGLPNGVELVSVLTGEVVSSHNLDVDMETGYLYVLNSAGNGIEIVDVSNPDHPSIVGSFDVPDVHDIHARGDVVYVAEGRSPTFSVWDVSDKVNPVMTQRIPVPDGGYVHNIWPTDDDNYLITTEETTDKTVKVWDISDPGNVELVGEWLGENRIAHNVHVQGHYAFLSHYTGGIIVVDISDPTHPTQVADYDTTPEDDESGFRGTWGATVPTPGGYVYGSDISGQLTVLKFHADDI